MREVLHFIHNNGRHKGTLTSGNTFLRGRSIASLTRYRISQVAKRQQMRYCGASHRIVLGMEARAFSSTPGLHPRTKRLSCWGLQKRCSPYPSSFVRLFTRFILKEACYFREGRGVGKGEFRIRAAYRDAILAQEAPQQQQQPAASPLAGATQGTGHGPAAAARPRFGPAARHFNGR